jgi:hypothetical protein
VYEREASLHPGRDLALCRWICFPILAGVWRGSTVFHRMGRLHCEIAPESTMRPSKHGEPSQKYDPAQSPVPVQLDGVEASARESACTVGPFTAAETLDMEPLSVPMIHTTWRPGLRREASAPGWTSASCCIGRWI